MPLPLMTCIQKRYIKTALYTKLCLIFLHSQADVIAEFIEVFK